MTRREPWRSNGHHDGGFTLVELLLASMITVLALSIVTAIFVSTIKAQQAVDSVATSASKAQLAASNIDNRIRNSSEFAVSTPSGTTDQLLVTRSASAGSTLSWTCYGWYYSSASGGSLRMTSTAAGTKIVAPTTSQLSAWTLLVSGIAPTSGSTIFSASGTQLSVGFKATAGSSDPTGIQFTTSKMTGVAETQTCY